MATSAVASWYWPFGDDDDDDRAPRLSELMEKASMLIDEAYDLATERKIDESVAKYREALEELDRVEMENAERAATPEFSSLRNKRAYVITAIDSMLLAEAKANAKAVAVSDTTELEVRFASRREAMRKAAANAGKPTGAEGEPSLVPKAESQLDSFMEVERERAKKTRKAAAKAKGRRLRYERALALLKEDPDDRESRLIVAGELVSRGRPERARRHIDLLLAADPNDLSALNLSAACHTAEGDSETAELELRRAIRLSPRDYVSYYNLASLLLKREGGLEAAFDSYRAGRELGGPADRALEEALTADEKPDEPDESQGETDEELTEGDE